MPITDEPSASEWARLDMTMWLHLAQYIDFEREREERERIEAKRKANSERMSFVARHKRGFVARRPWQALGMTKADWEAAGKPAAPPPLKLKEVASSPAMSSVPSGSAGPATGAARPWSPGPSESTPEVTVPPSSSELALQRARHRRERQRRR